MRRILLALAVAAMMAVMAASAAAAQPAPDAGAPIGACPPSFPNVDVPRKDPSLPPAHFGLVSVDYALALLGLAPDSPGVESMDVNNDGYTCTKLNPSGTFVVFVDNRFPLQK
jgi:hypothetical protein